MDKKSVGVWGEKTAVKYLKKRKYKIIETNFSCTFGEIDIIARLKKYLVFIEVKTRRNALCSGVYSIDRNKINKIVKTAQIYLKKNNITNKDIRFDVVTIEDENIELIENAFTEDGESF